MYFRVGGLQRVVWSPDEPSGGVVADPAPPEPVAAAEPAVQVSPPEPAQAEPAAAAPPVVDYRQRRIDKLTAQLAEARAQLAAKPADAAPAADMVPRAELDALAERRARELAAVADFNTRCNATAAAGQKAFGIEEFTGRVNSLKQLLDPADPGSIANYNLMLDAAMKTGRGAEIIHRLGGDPNEASRLMSLPPMELGMELAKLAVPTEPQRDTAAPRPITPIAQRGGARETIAPDDVEKADTLDTETWMKRREAQVKERASAA